MVPAPESFTLISFHFGDPIWIQHLLSQIDRFRDERITDVIVVDQSRSSEELLARLPGVSTVCTFPRDERDHARLGHDHPAAIEQVLTRTFTTSHVLLMDSDCFPVADGWLEGITGTCVAGDPNASGLSHPAFNVLPVDVLSGLDFRLGMRDLGFDTGRLIAFQLHRAGLPVQILKPSRRSFRGERGTFYNGDRLYHHGSGSFLTADEQRLSRKVHRATELAHRDAVLSGRFQLNARQRLALSIRSRLQL